jgi:hypothetical protein
MKKMRKDHPELVHYKNLLRICTTRQRKLHQTNKIFATIIIWIWYKPCILVSMASRASGSRPAARASQRWRVVEMAAAAEQRRRLLVPAAEPINGASSPVAMVAGHVARITKGQAPEI